MTIKLSWALSTLQVKIQGRFATSAFGQASTRRCGFATSLPKELGSRRNRDSRNRVPRCTPLLPREHSKSTTGSSGQRNPTSPNGRVGTRQESSSLALLDVVRWEDH